MDKQQIFFSIIIPHHNIPHLLERCLNSIPQRDDVQVVVVDDKSGEQARLELELLKEKYRQVCFIMLDENKGAGHARNVGLKEAKGKYVLFADADDYFNYCIDDVLSEYKNQEYDIIFFEASSLDTDTYHYTSRSWHLNRMIRRKRSKAEFDLRFKFGEPWCKIIKREVIKAHNICFEETIIHNDTRFSYLVGFYCKDAHIDRRALYCVTDRENSVSKQISIERLLVRTQVFTNANKFYKEHGVSWYNSKALRPMVNFLIKGDFSQFSTCFKIHKDAGFSTQSIIIKLLMYPNWLVCQFLLVMKRKYIVA